MKNYDCIVCNKMMTETHDKYVKYCCRECGILVEPPISIYGKWRILIKSFTTIDNQTYMNGTIIERKSFEECKRIWKLRTMW